MVKGVIFNGDDSQYYYYYFRPISASYVNTVDSHLFELEVIRSFRLFEVLGYSKFSVIRTTFLFPLRLQISESLLY